MDTIIILKKSLLPAAAYLLGSIPFGLVFTRCFGTVDIRNAGSGNIGATNVLRTSGKILAAATLTADILKGTFPVWYALSLPSSSHMWQELFLSLVALAAFFGHLFPLYSQFRHGGKGVATAFGCFIVISPATTVISLLIFILFVCMTRRVSAGSLAAAAFIPLIIWKTTGSPIFAGCAGIAACSIWIRHKTNIVRLLQGKEPPLGKKTC